MRLDPKLVHPSIFKATGAVAWSGGAGRDANVIAAHQAQWLKQYGVGCGAYGVVGLALFVIAAIGLKAQHIDRPERLLVLFGLVAAYLTLGGLAIVRNLRQLSVIELETLLPVLDLGEAGRAYTETIVALYRSGRPKTEIEETMAALNALLDEEAQLLATRNRMVGGEREGTLARLESERADLQTKVERTTDENARSAYEQSLVLLDERIAGFRADAGGVERIDAHLTLLQQATFATRDAARRLGTAVGMEPRTDSLRAAVAFARAQTTETERALAELRSI